MKCCAAFIEPHRTFDAKAHQTNKSTATTLIILFGDENWCTEWTQIDNGMAIDIGLAREHYSIAGHIVISISIMVITCIEKNRISLRISALASNFLKIHSFNLNDSIIFEPFINGNECPNVCEWNPKVDFRYSITSIRNTIQ